MCVARLQKAGACVHPFVTQYAGHLYDLGRHPKLLPLEAASGGEAEDEGVAAVVLVGGDGSFSEFVNGYLRRARALHIPPERRTPVCVVPGGSGNSFARDLYTSSSASSLQPEHALDLLLGQGCVKMVDVCLLRDEEHNNSVTGFSNSRNGRSSSSEEMKTIASAAADESDVSDHDIGLNMLSTNVVSWGLVGDTAVMAEDFRFLGDARYDVLAVWFLLRQIAARGKFVLKHLGGRHNVLRGTPLRFAEGAEAEQGGQAKNLEAASEAAASSPTSPPPSRSELTLAGKFTTAFFSSTQMFAKALRASPYARLDDGLVDVFLADAGLRRRDMATMFQQLPHGSHVKHKAISIFQVQQAQLHPPPPESTGSEAAAASEGGVQPQQPPRTFVLNVDGENKVATGCVDVRCLPRQMPVLAPLR
jgi:diacylglycerol kinase family enzyme